MQKLACKILAICALATTICSAKRRIINGVDWKIEYAPWHVNILFHGGQHCGGSILSQYYVLTAAHCLLVDNAYPGAFQVRYGTNKLHDRSGFNVGVHQYYTHANYDTKFYNNDIGILVLKSPIHYSKYASPVWLRTSEAVAGEVVTITGHGRTETTNFSNTLKATATTIVDWNECHRKYSSFFPITRNMVCANDARQAACTGDSGGPVMSENNPSQVGIVSWGPAILQNGVKISQCPDPNLPEVFTNLPKYRAWINANSQNTAQWRDF